MRISLTQKQNDFENIAKPDLNESEKSILKSIENNIEESLKELAKFIDNLKKQIDLVDESLKQKEKLNKTIENIDDDLTAIIKQCETPQLLIVAEDEARKTEAINLQIKNAREQLQNFEKWILQNLSNNELAKLSLANLNDNIASQNAKLNKLITPLIESIEYTKKLNEQKKSIVTKLDTLTEQAKNVHELEDSDKKSKELLLLKKNIQNLQIDLTTVEKNANQPNLYVLQIESLELTPVVENLVKLTNILNSEEQNVAQNLANAAAKAKILHNFDIIQNSIQKAEKIDVDPKAIIDDLHNAVTILQNLQTHFDDIEQVCNKLDLTNINANKIRNESIDQLAKKSELSKILCQSLIDRIDLLDKFNNEAKTIEDQIKIANQQLIEIKLKTASSNEIDSVLNNSQNILPNILALSELIDCLYPLSEPSSQKENLLQNCNYLINDLKKAKEDAEKVKKYENDVNKFTEELELIEHATTIIEQQCAAIDNKEDIENLLQKDLDNLHKLLETIKSKVAPNDHLKKQRQYLKERIDTVEKDATKKQNQIIEQKKLLEQFEKEVSTNENSLDELVHRYNTPQLISVAKKDANFLKLFREILVALPLDKLDNKQLRDNLLKRIEPLHVKADVIFFYNF